MPLKNRILAISIIIIVGFCSNLFGNESVMGEVYPSFPKLEYQSFPLDSGDSEKVKLRYPFKDSESTGVGESKPSMKMKDPDNVETEVEYNPETGKYEITQKMGKNINYRPPTYMDFDEYMEYQRTKSMRDYWKDKKSAEEEFEESADGSKIFKPQLKIKSKAFDRIFGGNTIDIRPSGSAEISLGARISKTENPVIPVRSQRVTTFQFDQNMQINLIGNIGDKLKVTANYNTQATFDFQNQFKIEYTGYDDEILQKIELGNVSLPLNSQLITGSQSLFGIKTKTKFGRLEMTTVLSQDKGQKSEVETKGGAQTSEFEVKADNYEANKHFFLDHFFRDLYEEAVSDPLVLRTSVNITKIEVWVTNTRTDPNARHVIAFQDLGTNGQETSKMYNTQWAKGDATAFQNSQTGKFYYPAGNTQNRLYGEVNGPNGFGSNRVIDLTVPVLQAKMGLDPRLDFQKVELARRLTENEYDLHSQLGFISLKQQINSNQVVSVAFEYTYNGQTFQVGEFSTDIPEPKPLMTKMLKSTELSTSVPMWKLMMKNVYSIGAYRVKKEGFKFNVWYLDQNKGVDINFIPEPETNDSSLVQLLNMDKLDFNGAPRSDGIFDFVDGITINTNNGRIIIPMLEPFGDGLRQAFTRGGLPPDRVDALMRTYAFDSLYSNTQADAKNRFPEKNRFTLKGEYQSESSSEISLNALNVPEGSVSVTAGGRQLVENQDYTVDYTIGRVKIINQSIIESGVPIKVSSESNQLFAQQQKNFFGHRMDYKVSDKFIVGGSLLHLWERPLTQKVDIGYEPISNWIWGVDATYKTDVPLVTRLVDKLPLIDTKEMSTFSASAEFAQLLPGHSKAIGKDGNSYVDDFEGSQNTIDMRSFNNWFLASTPQNQPELFPEGDQFNNLASGFNRALFSWRTIDPIFYQDQAPDNVKSDAAMLSNHFMRQIFETEVFPNRQIPAGQPSNIAMLDLSIYPRERGPYNFDIDGLDPTGRKFASGVDSTGKLRDPDTRWGGIMRRVDQNDFEAANIEYIQFWMMDPFNEDYSGSDPRGSLYFNLGNVSEDIMNDGQNLYEQLLPNNETVATDLNQDTLSNWGRVTRGTPFAPGFDNDPNTRPYQDVGLDGFRNEEELRFFNSFIQKARSAILPPYLDTLIADPASDDYNYFRDDDYDGLGLDILQRYKRYNGLEGNSPTQDQYAQQNNAGYPTSASTRPDREDINSDNVVNPVEAYFQYKVDLNRGALSPENVGNNFITDVRTATVSTEDGKKRVVNWYLFRIPVRTPNKTKHGDIRDFRSIRFIRMYMKGFNDPVHLRFARLELVRGEWRKFLGELDDNPEGITKDQAVDFNVGAVNIEENSGKIPVNYVLPPGIQRETNVNTTSLQQINEQALQLKVCGLEDGTAQAAYRTTELDLRMYGTLKMYVHAETLADQAPIEDDELTVFIRLGTDFKDHYYEYEIPVKVTPPGVYSPDYEPSQLQVWPEINNIEINLKSLTNLKLERDRQILDGASDQLVKRRYWKDDANGKMYITGNPNLGEVKTIMIGIRNPRKTPSSVNDDGLPKCAEVWVNELRLSDFNQQKGWATVGQANLKMADLANLVVTAGMSTPGWGSLEKKVSERQQETKKNVGVTAAVNLDKALPEKWGVKVPMYASYTADIEEPLFSPLAPDIEFKDYLEGWDTKSERDSVRKITTDRVIRKSLNFTNVRKERTGDAKPTPIDISNFSVSYAQTGENHTNFETQRDFTRTQKGSLTYNYSLSPKPVKPLSKVKLLRESDYLQLARELNFNYLPKSFSFSTSMDRMYNAFQMRNNNPGLTARLPEFYNKSFTWTRNYNFKYDITKNLTFDFSAANRALLEEPEGPAERAINDEGQWDEWKKEIWNQIQDLGTNMSYTHTGNFNYTVPLNYIPAVDWVSSSLGYGSSYTWTRAPLGREEFGAVIQNSNNFSTNANMNMRRLYAKSKYLQAVNQRQRRHQQEKARGKPQKKKPELDENADGEKAEEKKPKDKNAYTVTDRFAKFLMSLTTASVNYTRGKGLLVPGYNEQSTMLGMNANMSAPGWGFISGQQNDFEGEDKFWVYAGEKGWLLKNSDINNRVSQTYTENITVRASLEPLPDLRVSLNGSRQNGVNNTRFYRYIETDTLGQRVDNWVEQSPVEQGNFSISYNIIRTTLVRDDAGTYSNSIFTSFLENRKVISSRLGDETAISNTEHPLYEGYSEGYGPNSADVMIPAFLAAYSGKDAGSQKLSIFSIIPSLNWRVTYNGLSKISFIKRYFSSVTTSHGYTSTMSVGGFVTNQRYLDLDEISEELIQLDLDSNYITRYQYNSVTVSEQFSPLINFDMKFKNKIEARFELKTGRTVGLNIGSAQIQEQKNRTYTIGLGYAFPMLFPIEIQGKKPKSDLKLRADFSYRENRTMIRKIIDMTHTPTSGQNVFSVKATADYALSSALNLRAFYDYVLNIPVISNTFKNANTNFGLSIRFTIS